MSQKKTFLSSTLGKKLLMAATGLLLIGFLTSHLAGNFLLLDGIGGKDAFNLYAHMLTSNKLIYIAEAGLLGIFIVHIVSAIQVSAASRAARPQGYETSENLGKSTLASRTMLKSGSLILAFLIFHLVGFKFGEELSVNDLTAKEKIELQTLKEVNIINKQKSAEKGIAYEPVTMPAKVNKPEMRDLYTTVRNNLATPWYAALYILSMIVLGFHLCHGFQSAFKTLGFNHPKYENCMTVLSKILAITYALGYCIFPIYFLINGAA